MGEQRFRDNGDGTVTDTWTHLMWAKNDSYQDLNKFLNYPQAKKYLKQKNQEKFAGYTDWRFPDKKEAHSLYEKGRVVKDKYGMDIHIDPVFPSGCGYDTWTSNAWGQLSAYVYSFSSGSGAQKESDAGLNTSVRLVRGTFDNSRVKVGKIPPMKHDVQLGGGWR